MDHVVLVDGLWQVSPLTHSVQQLPRCQLVSPLVYPRANGARDIERVCGLERERERALHYYRGVRLYSRAVGLRQATQGAVFGQEAVLQVDGRLADLLVSGQHVVVVHHHPEVLVQREGGGELEHPDGKEEGDDNNIIIITSSLGARPTKSRTFWNLRSGRKVTVGSRRAANEANS